MLRSPKGTVISGMYQYEPKHDLSTLSQYEYNLVFLLMSIAGNSARKEDLYGMNGMMQSLFPNKEKAVEELMSKGYVTKDATLDEALDVYTLPMIKELLKAKGYPISGKKVDLIARLKTALSESEANAIRGDVLFWKPTPLGYEFIRSLYAEREMMEEQALAAFLKRDFTEGTSIIRGYQNRIPVSGAIGSYQATETISELEGHFSDKKMDLLSAITCFQYASGGRLLFPPLDAGGADDIQKTLDLEIRHMKFSLSTEHDMASYKDADIEYYDILCSDDSCDVCKKASKRKHKVSDAVIGKNAPPFHLGCRCATVAHFDD